VRMFFTENKRRPTLSRPSLVGGDLAFFKISPETLF
jgi:hypothetical protein